MSENVNTRSRTGSRCTTTEAPAVEDAVTEVAATEAAGPVDGSASDVAALFPDAGPDATTDGTPEVVAGGVVGWADAVPWLALRWGGSVPSAAELRFAPVVWRMLAEQSAQADQSGLGSPGRTALQMAAEAELAGHTELDPAVLAKVLARYEKAGVVAKATDGRLVWWSVLDPAAIVTQAQDSARESARAGASAARAGRTVASARVGLDGAATTPAGGLHDLVAEHLAQHPAEDFSPSQVAKILGGRSSGAVGNALERLTVTGAAVQTCAAPRRYQHRPDGAVAVPAVTDTADTVNSAHGADGGQE